MEINDFGCFRNGQLIEYLQPKDAKLLSPIAQKNDKKQRALLLLHGFSSSPAVFRYLTPCLTSYDYIYAPCLPGHGESFASFASLKGNELLTFVEKTGASLVKEYEKVDVLGISLGGLLAHYLSVCYPINHLFLLAPAFDLHLNIERVLALTGFLKRMGFNRLRSRAGNLYSHTTCEISFLQLPLTTVSEVLTLIHTYVFKASNCQTDLFLGMYDKVVASSKVAQRFADNKGCTHWLEQSAHVLPLDNDLSKIAAIIDATQT